MSELIFRCADVTPKNDAGVGAVPLRVQVRRVRAGRVVCRGRERQGDRHRDGDAQYEDESHRFSILFHAS
jgi:hypothetical protein